MYKQNFPNQGDKEIHNVVAFKVVSSELTQWIQSFLPLLAAQVAIDFLDSCVGQSVTVPEFQGHLENNVLVFGISFLDTRIN